MAALGRKNYLLLVNDYGNNASPPPNEIDQDKTGFEKYNDSKIN
jgi:hypothetical protein